MVKLKNIFSSIVKQEDVDLAIDKLKEAGVRDRDLMVIDRDTAEENIVNSGSTPNTSGSLVRAAQKFYGGGPLGFFRDIEKMKATSKVVIVNSKNLPRFVFSECERLFKKHPVFRKSKHFGSFVTEHYKKGTYMY